MEEDEEDDQVWGAVEEDMPWCHRWGTLHHLTVTITPVLSQLINDCLVLSAGL